MSERSDESAKHPEGDEALSSKAGAAKLLRLRALSAVAVLLSWGWAVALHLTHGGVVAAARTLFFNPEATTLQRLSFMGLWVVGLGTATLGGLLLGYGRSWTGRLRVGPVEVVAVLTGLLFVGAFLVWLPWISGVSA